MADNLKESIDALPAIMFSGSTCLGKFFRCGTSKSSTWQFFKLGKREWEYIRVQDYPVEPYDCSILVRDGWIVRRLESQDRHDYYLCQNGELSHLTKHEALRIAYEHSPRHTWITIIRRGDYLYLDTSSSCYFPPPHYKALLDLSVDISDMQLTASWLCFRSSDLPLVRTILDKIRVKLNVSTSLSVAESKEQPAEAEKPIDIRKMLSDTLTSAYGNYLKKEANIEKFLILVLNREWTSVQDEDLREKLVALGNASDQGNSMASSMLEFLEKASSHFDWNTYDEASVSPDIEGVVINTIPITFGKQWAHNYYKIIFPSLETTLYWPTTIADTRSGIGEALRLKTRLKTVRLRKWRIYPYLGRLKNTGTRKKDVEFQTSEIESLRRAFASATGVPTFEKILSERAYLDGFNLDMERWKKGAYNLSRYFLAVVQIVEPLTIDDPVPSTRVRDIFGNAFIIRWDQDTYFHCIEKMHSMQPGGWISVLVQNEFQNLAFTEDNVTIFETAPTIEMRFVRKEEACEFNLVAIAKYFGFVPKDILRRIVDSFAVDHDFDAVLTKAVEESLYEKEGIIYYIYQTLDKQAISELVELMANPSTFPNRQIFRRKWYITWSLIRTHYGLIHPIVHAKGLLKQADLRVPRIDKDRYNAIEGMLHEVVDFHHNSIKTRRRERISSLMQSRDPKASFHPTWVGAKEEKFYVRNASKMLRNFGNATIEAMGRRIAKAHAVVTSLTREFAYMEPKVARIDSSVQHEKGYPVRTVKFEVEVYGI